MTRRTDPFWRVFAITLVVLLYLASAVIYPLLQPEGRPLYVVPLPSSDDSHSR